MADGAVGVYKSWCQKLSSTRPEGKFKWSVQRYSTSSSSTGFLWARYVARSTLKQAQEQEVLYPVEFKQYLLIQSCFIASQWTLKETEESIEGHVINFFKAPNKIILLWKGALPLHPYLRNFVKGTQVRIKRSIKSLSSWLDCVVVDNSLQTPWEKQGLLFSGTWYLHVLCVHGGCNPVTKIDTIIPTT